MHLGAAEGPAPERCKSRGTGPRDPKEQGMKTGTGMALAVSAGYLLGRNRKLRRAVMLVGVLAVGRASGVGGTLLRRSAEAVTSSSGVGRYHRHSVKSLI
jgi:hypothetical protein